MSLLLFFSASGYNILGAASITEADDTLVATGYTSITGTAAITEADDTMSASELVSSGEDLNSGGGMFNPRRKMWWEEPVIHSVTAFDRAFSSQSVTVTVIEAKIVEVPVAPPAVVLDPAPKVKAAKSKPAKVQPMVLSVTIHDRTTSNDVVRVSSFFPTEDDDAVIAAYMEYLSK